MQALKLKEALERGVLDSQIMIVTPALVDAQGGKKLAVWAVAGAGKGSVFGLAWPSRGATPEQPTVLVIGAGERVWRFQENVPAWVKEWVAGYPSLIDWGREASRHRFAGQVTPLD